MRETYRSDEIKNLFNYFHGRNEYENGKWYYCRGKYKHR